MGDQFRIQGDNPHKLALEWVPRSADNFGGGQQGMRLIGSVYGEEVLFNALAIRDNTAHQSITPAANATGTVYDQVYALFKSAIILSTLNQAVSIQPVWSRDLVNWYPFNSPTSISAYSGSGNPQQAMIVLTNQTLYLPFVGLQATCSVAPASGTLNAWLERLG